MSGMKELMEIDGALRARFGKRVWEREVAAFFGTGVGQSTVGAWMTGRSTPTRLECKRRIATVLKLVRGEVEFPKGISWGGLDFAANAQIMEQFHAAIAAAEAVKDRQVEQRVKDAATGYGTKSLFKIVDQIGAGIERIERMQATILTLQGEHGAALNQLLKEWRTERKD